MRKLMIFATLLAAFSAGDALAEKITIRVAAFLPERSITVRFGFKPWMEGVQKEVGDLVTLQPYWGGALGRNPAKQMDLILDGITDVASVVAGYTPGRFPGVSIFELPYLFRSGVEGSEAMWRMYKAGHLGGYEDVKVIGFYTTDVYGIHSKAPLKSLDDLKGLKLRSAGPVQADTAKFFGAVPIGMPITQATEALSRGVVDGVIAGFSGLTIFRMQTIAKYHYAAPLSIAPLSSLMNKKKWESLPQRVKDAVDKYGGPTLGKVGGGGFDKTARLFKANMDKTGDHHYLPWSDDDIGKAIATIRPVHEAWIKDNENGQAKYDALIRIIADIRAGR